MKLLRKSKALGTPVANLIILVVVVMLSAVVTTFAISVTGNQAQKESLYLTKCNVWYKNSTYSLVSLVIVNNGPTDVILSKITIKGQDCPWNSTETYMLYNKTKNIVMANMPYVENVTNKGDEANKIKIGDAEFTFKVAGDDFVLQSGWIMLVYVVKPANIMIYDLGTPVRITVATAQGVYCIETNVKAAS
ncbi:MAG: hypothetical protein QXR17_04195 [Candidatus Bathyarchaeia archaeon]